MSAITETVATPASDTAPRKLMGYPAPKREWIWTGTGWTSRAWTKTARAKYVAECPGAWFSGAEDRASPLASVRSAA